MKVLITFLMGSEKKTRLLLWYKNIRTQSSEVHDFEYEDKAKHKCAVNRMLHNAPREYFGSTFSVKRAVSQRCDTEFM